MDTVDIIFYLLEKNKMSQQEFANALGITKYKVSEWKSKKTASYKSYISEIASCFGVSTDYLLGNEQKNKPIISEDERLISEGMEMVKLLPIHEQKRVLDYIQFVLAHQDDH